MSFDTFMLAFFALCAAFALVTVARALRTGRCGYGSAAVVRATDPAHFWYLTAIFAALSAALAVRLFDPRAGSGTVPILLALSFAYYPLRWLRTGEAGWEHALFSRREEPLEYWLIVAAVAAFALAMFGLGVLQSARPWP